MTKSRELARSRASKPRMTKKRRGPDPGITDALTATICESIVAGVTIEGSAAAAGVPRSTFYDWLSRARQPEAPQVYRDFAEAVAQALGQFELEKIKRVNKGDERWQAAAWLLERRFPDRYGRRTRIDGRVEVSALVESQEWVSIRDRILVALQPFPDALAAVVGALSEPDEVEGELVEGE